MENKLRDLEALLRLRGERMVKMTSAADIDALIQQLQEIKAQIGFCAEAEINFVMNGGGE